MATKPEEQTPADIVKQQKAMREAVIANVHLQVHLLKQNPVIDKASKAGKIRVVAAFYEIGSGAADLLETAEELRPSAAEMRAVTQQVRLSTHAPGHHHPPALQAASQHRHQHSGH